MKNNRPEFVPPCDMAACLFSFRVWKHLLSLILSTWLCAFSSPVFPDGYTELVQIASNNAGHFIKVGDNVTYRRYQYYMTKEGFNTLFNGIALGIMTRYVDYEVARDVSSLTSSKIGTMGLFASTLLFTPVVVRSLLSWGLARRLATEEIRINSDTIKELFYIELSYSAEEEREFLKLLPIPETLVSREKSKKDLKSSASQTFWQNFHKSLLQAEVTSVQLSWHQDQEGDSILVYFTTARGETLFRTIKIESTEKKPDSIESLLHHEWPFDRHSDSAYVPTVSLLKYEVIMKVMESIASEGDSGSTVSLKSILTFIQQQEFDGSYGVDLCSNEEPDCGTHLNLLWQPAPYPHYRARLEFSYSEPPWYSYGVTGATLEQIRDQNLAELTTELFEQLTYSTVMLIISSFQEYHDLYPADSPKITVINALNTGKKHLVSTNMPLLSVADVRDLFALLHKHNGLGKMSEAIDLLNNNNFKWLDFFLPDNGPRVISITENMFPPFIKEVMELLLSKKPVDFYDKMLEMPLKYFFIYFEKLPELNKIEALIKVFDMRPDEVANILPLLPEYAIKDLVRHLSSHHAGPENVNLLCEVSCQLAIFKDFHDLLSDLIIEYASKNVDTAKKLVTDQQFLFNSIEKVLIQDNADLIRKIALVDEATYFDFLLRLRDANLATAKKLLLYMPDDMQKAQITYRIHSNKDEIEFLLLHAKPKAVAAAVWESLKRDETDYHWWLHMPANTLPLLLEQVTTDENIHYLLPLIKWYSLLPEDVLNKEMPKLNLSEKAVRWLSTAINSLVDDGGLEHDKAVITLASIADSSQFTFIEPLMQPISDTLSTNFLNHISKTMMNTPDLFDRVVRSMSETQSFHYVSKLMNLSGEELNVHYRNAYVVIKNMSSYPNWINRFSSKAPRYDRIKNWHEKCYAELKDGTLKAELTCPICCNIFDEPVTIICGHNFCKKCLTLWLERKQRQRILRINAITCCYCNQEIPINKNGWSVNHSLKRIIDILKLNTNAEAP